MRILFVNYRDIKNPSAIGGDFYLWELARGLAALGHQVTMLCSSFPNSKSHESLDGLEIIRVPDSPILPLKIFITYLTKLKGQFDVVVEEIIGGQRLPFFGVLYAQTPLVAVLHQRNAKIFRQQYPFFMALPLSCMEYILAFLYRRAVVVTPSEGAKTQVRLLGLKSNQINVVYDGVGSNFQNVQLANDREDLVVCLGKLRRYKRIDHSILAFKKALEYTRKPAKLIIAGKLSEIDRGYLVRLQELSKQLDIEHLVEFRINISEDEKIELLNHAKVLVQPSPVEGFSIVVAEANRCGTPVVVSDGVPFDVVRNGLNGYVFPFGDIDRFATGIAKLLSDNATWRGMSMTASEWSKQFTWKASTIKLEQIIEGLIDSRLQYSEIEDNQVIEIAGVAATI